MTTSAPLVKAGLVDASRTLFAPTLVTYGAPGSHRPDEVVAVMGQRTVNSVATMATSRPRDEVVETVVVLSVYRSGDETVQQDATERAYALLDQLTEYLRGLPGPNLLGVTGCRTARVTEHELDETVITRDGKVTGRSSAIAAVVTSTTRV